MDMTNQNHEELYEDYRYRYLNGKDLELTTPVDISLELSSLCNMMCTYCYHGDKANLPFNMKFMKKTLAEKIIYQAHELGVSSIKFNWRGESTLNPHFRFLTKLAAGLARGSTFIDRLTNSNFKFPHDRDDIFAGLSYQTKVKVSYDSFRKDVFEKQRAGGDHDLTTANIDKFYNLKGRKNRLVIQAVRTQANKNEDFEGEIAKKWPSAELSVRDVVEDRLQKDISSLLVKERSKERVSCLQAHVRLIFAHDGTASPCCPDIKQEIPLGNIKKTHMKDIFNGFLAKRLRAGLIKGTRFEANPCLNCSSQESYAGYVPNGDS